MSRYKINYNISNQIDELFKLFENIKLIIVKIKRKEREVHFADCLVIKYIRKERTKKNLKVFLGGLAA